MKWQEMKPVAVDLIRRMHAGHASGEFQIPVVDFIGVFAPDAPAKELAKLEARGAISFQPEGKDAGTFTLAAGDAAYFDLGRERLVIKVPKQMHGTYSLPDADSFRIDFAEGAGLEGCKRILVLICNRVLWIEVSASRVDIKTPNRMSDLSVVFD